MCVHGEQAGTILASLLALMASLRSDPPSSSGILHCCDASPPFLRPVHTSGAEDEAADSDAPRRRHFLPVSRNEGANAQIPDGKRPTLLFLILSSASVSRG